MTDTFATTARHPSAAIAWVDKTFLYVELPTEGGPPYIVRYHKTTDGLIAALNILIENPVPETRSLERNTNHPAIRKITPNISDATRATAAEIVRRMLK